MFREAMEHFDLKGMTLLADREYVGAKWFKCLVDNKIEFVIRLRFGDYYQAVNEAPGKTYQQMYDQCLVSGKFCRKRIELGDRFYFISIRSNPKMPPGDEVIIFLTRIRPVKKTVDQYVKRWRIECLFRHLKTNGFGLEAINFKPVGRSNLLMAIVGLSYALTIRVGWAARSKIRIIQYADGTVFPADSVFRKGLSLLTPGCARLELFLSRYLSLDDGRNHPIFKNLE
jgi:hypothetical protein